MGSTITGTSLKRQLGLHLANIVRNEINAGVCIDVPIDKNINCEQLNGLELKRFKARLQIKKYRKKISKLYSFSSCKRLTEKQCDYVDLIVRHYKKRVSGILTEKERAHEI